MIRALPPGREWHGRRRRAAPGPCPIRLRPSHRRRCGTRRCRPPRAAARPKDGCGRASHRGRHSCSRRHGRGRGRGRRNAAGHRRRGIAPAPLAPRARPSRPDAPPRSVIHRSAASAGVGATEGRRGLWQRRAPLRRRSHRKATQGARRCVGGGVLHHPTTRGQAGGPSGTTPSCCIIASASMTPQCS